MFGGLVRGVPFHSTPGYHLSALPGRGCERLKDARISAWPFRPCAAAARPHFCAMQKHQVTLTEPLEAMVAAQIKSGRYNDYSAALQEAAWHYFVGTPDPFREYGVTQQEVDGAARRELSAIRKARKSGKLRAWTPPS